MRCHYQQEINVCPAEVMTDKLEDLYCPHHLRVVKAKEAAGIIVKRVVSFAKKPGIEGYDYE
jgi:hypothetical protein